MKIAYSQDEFDKAKPLDLLKLICYRCGSIFLSRKANIKQEMKYNRNRSRYCSQTCHMVENHPITRQEVECLQCKTLFIKKAGQIKKSSKHFCSHSCACTYGNTHKTKGYRRSRLEVWLEIRLQEAYPDLEFHFNRKDTINSELDIYIPSLKLAFELNGIFHYEPIYGQDTLDKVKDNDNRKFKACLSKDISLCIIDSSKQSYFKESTSKIYLDIITRIINENLQRLDSN